MVVTTALYGITYFHFYFDILNIQLPSRGFEAGYPTYFAECCVWISITRCRESIVGPSISSPRAMYGIATVFLTITAPQPAFSERSHARQIRCIHIYSLYKKCGPEADRIAQNSNYRFSLHSIKATFGFVAHFYWVNKDKSSVHICAVKL